MPTHGLAALPNESNRPLILAREDRLPARVEPYERASLIVTSNKVFGR